MEITHNDLAEITGLIKVRYGYDFSGYAEASLKRRIARFCQLASVTLFDLKYNITNDKHFFSWFLESLTVNVTEMFRDPAFYRALAARVLPVLATYPFIKIWHAGCATGEEAFSMAILLHEAGLLDRARIYATDMNNANLERAAAGIIPMHRMKEYTANYIKAGGRVDFSDYYSARYNGALINKELRKNILFSQHNLVTDEVFNEFQLICCRNVMIYFNRSLQNHVVELFSRSLSPLGFLAIGTKESLSFTGSMPQFDVIDNVQKIYKRKA